MKRLLLVLFILLGLLQYRFWLGDNNLPAYFSMKKKIIEQQQNNDKLLDRNQVLKEEIHDLRSGTEALEERARNELGMVKQGETFFRVADGGDSSQSL